MRQRSTTFRIRRYLLVGGLAVLLILVLRNHRDNSDAFTPPSAKERRKAIGRVDHLPPVLQLAFSEGDCFEPIPRPEPGDWLARFREYGQTYDQFARCRPHSPNQDRKMVYLQPLGEFDAAEDASLETLRQFAEAFFFMEADLLPPVDIREGKFTCRTNEQTGQLQLLTQDVLKWLAGCLPDDACFVLAVTMVDLYPDDDWNFVFGQASLSDRVGVYSLARYQPSFYGQPAGEDADRLAARRACKVLAHESCHMFSMEHCIYYHCLMNGGNHMDEADSQPMHLCPVCLRKLHAVVEFDVPERYGRLLKFSEQIGFDDEAAWLSRRLDRLRGS